MRRRRMAELGGQTPANRGIPRLTRRRRRKNTGLVFPPITRPGAAMPRLDALLGTEGWSTKPRGMGIGDVELVMADQGAAVLRDDGSVWGWGYHGVGAFDNIETSYHDPSQPEYRYDFIPYHAMPVSFMTGVSRLVAGAFQFYAIKEDGTLWHWGEDDWHTSTDDLEKNGPQRVGTHDDIVDVCHTGSWTNEGCVYRREDGSIWAAGFSEEANYAIPGSPPYNPPRLNPVEVTQYFPEGIVQWFGDTVDDAHALVTADGDVWVWGASESYLDSTTGEAAGPAPQYSPINNPATGLMRQVPNISNATHVSVGYRACAAITSDGKVVSWGYNDHGILGSPSTSYIYNWGTSNPLEYRAYVQYPTEIPGLSNVTHLDYNWDGGIVRLANGQVWGWGWNEDGCMGLDDIDATYPLTRIYIGHESAGPVGRGSFTMTCVIDEDCVPWCMGMGGDFHRGEPYPSFLTMGNPIFDLYKILEVPGHTTLDIYADEPLPMVLVTGVV